MLVKAKQLVNILKDDGYKNITEADIMQVVNIYFPASLVEENVLDLDDNEIIMIENLLTYNNSKR